MTLAEVMDLLDADVVVGHDRLDIEISSAFCADLMSDVLAFARSGCLLVTGLASLQAVRTAFALDIAAIVICRGKTVNDAVARVAEELNIVVLRTPLIMFEICGRLWEAGVTGSMRGVQEEEECLADQG